MMRVVLYCAAAFLSMVSLVASPDAWAACPDDASVAAMASDILAAKTSEPVKVATIEDGLCAQNKLVAIMRESWGNPVGYKVGLTSKPAQDMFGVHEPVRGLLLAGMMLDDGARVPAKYGALPRFEADMIVVVADQGINAAKTPKEVLAHLLAVRPFIELPDLVVDSPNKLNGPMIEAINVGARLGVLGAAVPVEQTEAFLSSLGDMTVTVTDQDGKELTKAPGSAVLGHPLNSVLWLMGNGVTLKAGDLVSLGSFGPLLAPKPGLTATLTYVGLPGDPTVSVTFE